MLIETGAALLKLLPPETAHRATLSLLSYAAPLVASPAADDPRLGIDALGLHFSNPIGLAAGFDKDGVAPGCEWREIRLRLRRVRNGDAAPANRKPASVASSGSSPIAPSSIAWGSTMRAWRRWRSASVLRKGRAIIGINIGANKDSEDRRADYRDAFAKLAPFASYVTTINVSSPNTPGLRGLQNRGELEQLLALMTETRARMGIARTAASEDRSRHRPHNRGRYCRRVACERHRRADCQQHHHRAAVLAQKSRRTTVRYGLSWRASLRARRRRLLRAMRQRIGARLALVGVGGIASGADAYAKIRAGASLVQLYTALAYDGPGLVTRLKTELLECLARDGHARLSDAVGVDA